MSPHHPVPHQEAAFTHGLPCAHCTGRKEKRCSSRKNREPRTTGRRVGWLEEKLVRIRTLLAITALIIPAMLTAPELVLGAGPGQASPNVEHVATIPLEVGTWVTGRIHGDYLYVTGNKSFSIFDI